jgi:uncharacterized protein YaaQ
MSDKLQEIRERMEKRIPATELEQHLNTCGDCTDMDLCEKGEIIQMRFPDLHYTNEAYALHYHCQSIDAMIQRLKHFAVLAIATHAKRGNETLPINVNLEDVKNYLATLAACCQQIDNKQQRRSAKFWKNTAEDAFAKAIALDAAIIEVSRLRAGLMEFVSAAKSWHESTGHDESGIVQCDRFCELMKKYESALSAWEGK